MQERGYDPYGADENEKAIELGLPQDVRGPSFLDEQTRLAQASHCIRVRAQLFQELR